MLFLKARALHFVLRVVERTATVNFFRNVLGMKVLRHEEFSEGCEASCNGLFNNRWSKTMIGYGPEDTHFVVELTYNYGVDSYKMGNDLIGLTIRSQDVINKINNSKYPVEKVDNKKYVVKSPDGYNFFIINESSKQDPIEKVSLASSNLKKTIDYWNGVLGLKIVDETESSVSFAFGDEQCILEFVVISEEINHGEAYGRVAFAVPEDSLPLIEKTVLTTNNKVLKSLVSLKTPGKATVKVVILADPDGHEICFVNEEGFSELSTVDPLADQLVDKFMRLDRSRMKSS